VIRDMSCAYLCCESKYRSEVGDGKVGRALVFMLDSCLYDLPAQRIRAFGHALTISHFTRTFTFKV
jgi:hypothetical protein